MTETLENQLNQDIARLYQEADDYNVKITVGEEPNEQTFFAHSVILRARSPFFRAALSHKWRNTQDSEDKITFSKPNIHPKIFRIILKYLYTGTVSFYQKNNDYTSLLIAADELALTSLVDHIQDHIINEDIKWLQRQLVQ
ncbi:2922_t:CDS:2, partial [Ambispora leptoticha]